MGTAPRAGVAGAGVRHAPAGLRSGAGGEVVFEGSYAELLEADTLTGRHLKQALPIKEHARPAKGYLPIRNAQANNLRDVNVDIPVGVLTAITGAAGSGKSSLIDDVFLGSLRELQGLGRAVHTDMGFLEGVKTPCEICQGRRFKEEVLTYRLNGQSIADVLASELHKKGSVYVLDEPTTGLHMSDFTHLLTIVNRLVDGGNSVIVIEHNLDVICNADWVIDLGPEGGSKGGRVVFEGTPRQLVDAPGSLTGQYLRPRAREAVRA